MGFQRMKQVFWRVLFGAMFLVPMHSQAAIIYDFAGIMDSCSIPEGVQPCSGTVTGVLTLTDAYVPGTLIPDESSLLPGGVFISLSGFMLGDTIIDDTDYLIDQQGVSPLPLPASGSSTNVDILVCPLSACGHGILTVDGGGWSTGVESVYGHDGTWTLRPSAIPEPSIIALFAAGLFGLGFARRRKA